jgi:hypothetical protein
MADAGISSPWILGGQLIPGDPGTPRSGWVNARNDITHTLPAGIGAAGTMGLSLVGPATADSQSYMNLPGGNMMPYYPGGTPGFHEGGGGGLFDNILGGLGNLSPAILAGYLGNSQRQDVMGQVGRLNTLGDSLSGTAFMNSITNPYDQQTGLGRNALMQNLQQRGVGGSSFGNQQLGNFDYQRGLGRGDLATRAQAGIAGTQGQLYSDALRGMVGGNAAYNQLLGAGLGASGSLFNRGGAGGSTGNGLFDWLRNQIGGSAGGIPGSLPTDPNAGGQVDFGNDPSLGIPTEFDPSIDWSSLYG